MSQIEKANETPNNQEHTAENGIVSIINSRLPEIIRELDALNDDVEVETNTYSKVRTGWRSPNFLWDTTYYPGGYKPEKPLLRTRFFLKTLPPSEDPRLQACTPEQLPIPIEREWEMHKLFRSCKSVPHAYYEPFLGNNIILKYAGGLTSEDKLAKLNNGKAEEEEEKILKVIAEFNAYALDKTAEALQNPSLSSWIQVKKPSLDQATRYFKEALLTTTGEANSDLIGEFTSKFPIILELYGQTRNQLTHFDLGRQNIVGPEDEEWTSETIKIVDLGSPALGNGTGPVAQFLTSAGSKPDSKRWNSRLECYMKNFASAQGVSGGRGIRFRNEYVERSKQIFYAAVLYDSLKGLSKMGNLKRNSTSEHDDYGRLLEKRPVLATHDSTMKKNNRVCLKYILSESNEMGLPENEAGEVASLMGVYQKANLLE
ncbi:MAG: hypothetical protein ABH840_00405 [Nanoarchaeota archaeon]